MPPGSRLYGPMTAAATGTAVVCTMIRGHVARGTAVETATRNTAALDRINVSPKKNKKAVL